MKGGITFSDYVTTVSPTYSEEIRTPHFGYGLDGLLNARADHLSGIINGIDTKVYNPATDPKIYTKYRNNLLKRRRTRSAFRRNWVFP